MFSVHVVKQVIHENYYHLELRNGSYTQMIMESMEANIKGTLINDEDESRLRLSPLQYELYTQVLLKSVGGATRIRAEDESRQSLPPLQFDLYQLTLEKERSKRTRLKIVLRRSPVSAQLMHVFRL